MAKKQSKTTTPVAAGYGRKSSVKFAKDAVTVAKQREFVQAEADKRSEILTWFEDATGNRTGKYEHTRPGYQDLLKFIAASNDVRSVIFYELDRVGRSIIIIDKILKICAAKGLAFICIRNGIDTSRGIGANEIAQIQMQAVFAELESNRTSERISEMAKYYVANGVPWGRVPFGAMRFGEGIEAKFDVHPEHAPTIRAMMTAYCVPMSYDDTKDHLNNLGMCHVDRYGRREPWTREAVRTTIGNLLFYCGYVVPEHWRAKHARIVVEGSGSWLERYARGVGAIRSQSITPILSEELANAVIERRHTIQIASRKPSGGWIPLLTPIAHWQGQKLRGDTAHSMRTYRTRGTGISINADKADADIVYRLSQLKIDETTRAHIRAYIYDSQAQNNDAQTRIDAANEKLARYADLFADGMLTRAIYNQRHDELQREIKRETDKLNAPTIADKVLDSLSSLSQLLPLATPERKRRLIHSLFSRIDFGDNGEIERIHPREWAIQAFSQIAHAHRAFNASGGPEELSRRDMFTWLIMAVAASYATKE